LTLWFSFCWKNSDIYLEKHGDDFEIRVPLADEVVRELFEWLSTSTDVPFRRVGQNLQLADQTMFDINEPSGDQEVYNLSDDEDDILARNKATLSVSGES
jgi:hypothetical protein